MHGEPQSVPVPARHRLSLAIGVLSTLGLVIAGCRAPLPNPKHSADAKAEVASSADIVDSEHAVDAQPETQTAPSRPFRIEDLALDAPLQPAQLAIDPTGETSWGDMDDMFHSPLWMPRAYPSDGRYPPPPGRAQQESVAMAFLISVALIATLQHWAK